MSAQQISPAEMIKNLAYLTKDYMPDATWSLEGAFRFDTAVIQLCNSYTISSSIRKITSVAGCPACLWSLDWCTERRPMALQQYTQVLDAYTRMRMGIILVFDNPHIREEDLKDAYGMFMVEELAKRNAARQHAVSVANDQLAEYLRQRVPSLPIYCHVNRVITESPEVVRNAQYYNDLAQKYNRVCLHPDDAVKPEIYTAIAEPARMDVVVNIPCLRNCPLRREHLRILADYRHEPYNVLHGRRRRDLINRAGCYTLDKNTLQQKRTNILTKNESRALYEAGYRSFIIQSQQFRNETTMMWDVAQSLFAPSPEITNKIAVLTAEAMSGYVPKPRKISSGLGIYTSFNYD